METGKSKMGTGNWKMETGNWKIGNRNPQARLEFLVSNF
jgi:hypothetical protein